jgi:hypothetical protein
MTNLPPLPTCTKGSLALANLDVQITCWGRHSAAGSRPADGLALIAGLLNRHAMSAEDEDLRRAENVAAGLREHAPDHPEVPIVWAEVATPRSRSHRPYGPIADPPVAVVC